MKRLLLICFILLIPVFTVYGSQEPLKLSYNDALFLALYDLSSIATLDENAKLMQEQLDDLQKLLRDTRRNPAEPNLLTDLLVQMMIIPPQPTVAQLRHAISNLERQMESLELNRRIINTGIEMSLRNALVNIANLELDINLLEATIELNEENLRRTTLRRQFGLASDNDQRVAEQTLTQNRTNLETLLITLANEKQSLSKILQLPLEQVVTVEWERRFVQIPDNLQGYIEVQTAASPVIKQREIAIEIRKANLDINEDDSKKLSLQNEYDQALRELNDAKLALEAAIRLSNQNKNQLLTREEALKIDAEKAADQERTLQAHLNLGFITQFEIDQIRLSILNTEIQLEKNLNQLWVLQFAYLNPFLLA
jgi:hypothetical protein